MTDDSLFLEQFFSVFLLLSAYKQWWKIFSEQKGAQGEDDDDDDDDDDDEEKEILIHERERKEIMGEKLH